MATTERTKLQNLLQGMEYDFLGAGDWEDPWLKYQRMLADLNPQNSHTAVITTAFMELWAAEDRLNDLYSHLEKHGYDEKADAELDEVEETIGSLVAKVKSAIEKALEEIPAH